MKVDSNTIFENNNTVNIVYDMSSTSGLILYSNQSFIFETLPIKYVDLTSYNDSVSGYPWLFDVYKEFRYSKDNIYTNWIRLTNNNLANIDCSEKLIQFRYSAIYNEQDYNTIIFINKLSNNWQPVYSDTMMYMFDKNYPEQGEYVYFLKYGYDNSLHYNSVTNKFVVKNNGYWSSPFSITITESNIYPKVVANIEITEKLISEATTSGFYPINDISLVLNTNIKFTSNNSYPLMGDNIFLNVGETNGGEYIEILYYPPIITERPYIYLTDFKLTGLANFPTKTILDIEPNSYMTYKIEDTIKMFSLCDFCISIKNGVLENYLDVKFRYSFNSRWWETQWIDLDNKNLSCIKGTPIKFFYIEFLFYNKTSETVQIDGIELFGEFQNITADSRTINKFGISKECLEQEYVDYDNNCIAQMPDNWNENSECYIEPSFNPYDMNMSIQLYEKIANDISNLFGWEIDYYRVEPSDSGIDYLLHEYGTYNKVAEKKVKVLVPENNFPEERVEFNMFDLAMFDSFEIHITKKEFYKKFGTGIRPAKDDYLFFCQINKWFKVEHAHSVRNFNNSSVYYKLILVKKQDDKQIDNGADSVFDTSIINNSLENLFGNVVQNNINKVANKAIQEDLTEQSFENVQIEYENVEIENESVKDFTKPDPIFYKQYSTIVNEELMNATTIICKSYYNFNSRTNKDAIVYGYSDTLDMCSNRGISLWFNIHTYKTGQVYNLLDNYNFNTKEGYRIDFLDGIIEVIYFDQSYEFNVSISPAKWYGVVVNFNAVNKEIELSIHRRNKDGYSSTSNLDVINLEKVTYYPKETTSNIVMHVTGSPMYFANLRVFNDIIESKDVILNQYIIRDTDKLLVGDNNIGEIISPNHKF